MRYIKILLFALLPFFGTAQIQMLLAGDTTLTGGGGGPIFSTEYQAVINKATALGYTKPSVAQQGKQDTLMRDLIAIGALDTLDVIYIFANDGSAEFATINWINPDTLAGVINAPTWTSNEGYQGNASNAYINLKLTPSDSSVNNYTVRDASVIFGVFTNPTVSGTEGWIGTRNGSSAGVTGQSIFFDNGSFNYRFNSTTNTAYAYSDPIGIWHIYQNSTGSYVYLENSLVSSNVSEAGIS